MLTFLKSPTMFDDEEAIAFAIFKLLQNPHIKTITKNEPNYSPNMTKSLEFEMRFDNKDNVNYKIVTRWIDRFMNPRKQCCLDSEYCTLMLFTEPHFEHTKLSVPKISLVYLMPVSVSKILDATLPNVEPAILVTFHGRQSS